MRIELGALDVCDLAGLDALQDAARAAHDAGIAPTFRGMSAQLMWLNETFPPRRPLRALRGRRQATAGPPVITRDTPAA